MATAALRAARSAALLIPQQRRLDFPVPHLGRAIARLGQAGVPSSNRLRSLGLE
ncbi:hypothetical protein P3T34_000256 [Kitasatospora sp. MAP12-44]|uniref:hypothetical protein n=1 Tax=unclassified Kitasatospora TaxID=2633591 RepID=UPI0024769F02|nr:hypothetical protein [Kitasatospora sp. MAP12-44]MDH6108041.1 hypothetical protein [Kitasatospora sp. MAP12-44]